MAAAFGAGIFGAASGYVKARENKRRLRLLQQRLADPAIQAFLQRFFPAAIPGGKFANAYLAQAADRNATAVGNKSQQLMALLGQNQNVGAGQGAGINAALGLAGNQNLNAAGLNLAQLQGNMAAQAIPIHLQRELGLGQLTEQIGNTSRFAGALEGFQQGFGGGLAGGSGGGMFAGLGGGGSAPSAGHGTQGMMPLDKGTFGF